MTGVAKIISDYQIDLFQHVGEFFGRAIGMPATEFATIEDSGDKIRKEAYRIGHRAEDAFRWADTELRAFYARRGGEIFGFAKRLGGMKLVLGGSSRFHGSQLASVRGSLIYADTILIPDPVFPWLEAERSEEKFRHGSRAFAFEATRGCRLAALSSAGVPELGEVPGA